MQHDPKLKEALIKLGYTNPELRPHLREILTAAGKGFQALFGELRSVLDGKKDARTYKEVLRVLTDMVEVDPNRTKSEVFTYAERALSKFPDEVRTFSSLTLDTIRKPESRVKAHFGKVYTDKNLSKDHQKDPWIARKVLLQSTSQRGLMFLSFVDSPLTNDEIQRVLARTDLKLTSIDLTDRDMPADTLRKMHRPPSFVLNLEGNPRISRAEAQKLQEEYGFELILSNLHAEMLSAEDMYDLFAEDLMYMFDGRTRSETGTGGAPIIKGDFGEDARMDREGTYTIEMFPVKAGDDTIRFRVQTLAHTGVYRYDEIHTFKRPSTDSQGIGGSNRNIARISSAIQNILYDIMTAR